MATDVPAEVKELGFEPTDQHTGFPLFPSDHRNPAGHHLSRDDRALFALQENGRAYSDCCAAVS